jgi:hypothetical protein
MQSLSPLRVVLVTSQSDANNYVNIYNNQFGDASSRKQAPKLLH